MIAHEDNRESRFFGPIGAGVGGSSVFYAATLERPEPHDLNHSKTRPHPTGGWPVSFNDFAPYLPGPKPSTRYPVRRIAKAKTIFARPPAIAPLISAYSNGCARMGVNPTTYTLPWPA